MKEIVFYEFACSYKTLYKAKDIVDKVGGTIYNISGISCELLIVRFFRLAK